jgi:hypothetical protein
MQVVTPGSASSRAGSIGLPHQVHDLGVAMVFVLLISKSQSIDVPGAVFGRQNRAVFASSTSARRRGHALAV